MNFIQNGLDWDVNETRFQTDWGPPHSPPEAHPLYALPTTEKRNLADVLWRTPEMLPFRATDSHEKPSQEPTDHQPVNRTFNRRLIGVLSSPLTLISREFDTLPLNLRVESAQADWLRFLLSAGGFPAVDGIPTHMLRRLLRHLDEIVPLGRTQSLTCTIESTFGRAGRTLESSTAGNGTITLTTTLTTPDGDTYTITEKLPVQLPSSTTSAREVKITLPANAPDWLERQLHRLTPAHFSPNIERTP